MGATPNWLYDGAGALLKGAQDPGAWNDGGAAPLEDPIDDQTNKYASS